jgi:hypothetical protein
MVRPTPHPAFIYVSEASAVGTVSIGRIIRAPNARGSFESLAVFSTSPFLR